MEKHQCIYCLQKKDKTEFNREHVVPRMMGTYTEAFVLGKYEVCQECNSYFSREIESSTNLNSAEGFLRMQHGAPMSDGRRMRKDRVTFQGTEGLFKGLQFTPVVDSTNNENMHLDISPRIGILADPECQEYNYFELDDLPEATPEVTTFLKGKTNGIITVNISTDEATPILKSKGYLDFDFKADDVNLSQLYQQDSLTTNIHISIDSIVRRLCAKTVFNYLCYSNGKGFVLAERFNTIREYIRNGKWSDNLWFRYSKGPVSSVCLPNATAHVVGYMWYPDKDHWSLSGCLTWFGEITYIFKLCDTELPIKQVNLLPCTKMAIFDNQNRVISEDEAVYIFSKPSSD